MINIEELEDKLIYQNRKELIILIKIILFLELL